MRKAVLIIATLMLFAMGSVVYAGQFGPPEPAAKEGKTALGIGYFYHTAKWKSDSGSTKEMTQNQAYLQLGYGFIKNWEAYLRVGGADSKIKDAFETSADDPNCAGFKSDFKDGYKPFGTIGVKGVFNVSDSFGIGPFLQASLYSSYKDETAGTYNVPPVTPASQTMKVKKPSEINLGIGLQGKIGEAIIYGGPVAYWTKAKAEWTVTITGVGTETDSVTVKEKNNIGGFAGIRLPLGKNVNLEVEGQYKSRFSMGGALTYSF